MPHKSGKSSYPAMRGHPAKRMSEAEHKKMMAKGGKQKKR